jgi:hypothetical protein
MAFPSKELLSAFPIDQLFLIISAGLLFTIFIPFDIFALDFTNGLIAPNLLNIPMWITENFKPFIMVKYLADFPNGLVQIFLVSLIPGVLIFFLQDLISWTNGKIMKQRFSRRITTPKSWKGNKAQKTKQEMEFNDWLRKKERHKYINFLWSLHSVAIGLLYAFESLFLTYLILTVIAAFNQSFLFWIVFFLIMSVASWLVYLASLKRFSKLINIFIGAFQYENELKTASKKS